MRVLVLIPTTGGPLLVRGLKPRPALPGSAAFADGDYRPLPWSADYARLSAPDGPLARIVPPGGLVPHELRLDRSFDAGRSWEAPVALAHGLSAQGHAIVRGPGEADTILWATGAVDLDLTLIPGDYALLDKVEASRTLLERHPDARLAVLLPPGRDRDAALAALASLRPDGQVEPIDAASIGAALDALAGRAAATVPTRAGRRTVGLAAAAAVVALALGLGAWGLLRGGASSGVGPVVTSPVAARVPDPPPAILAVEELRARAGSSCRRVVFGADGPERRPVAVEASGRVQPSRLTPELCGLSFRIMGGAPGSIEVGAALTAVSLPPAAQPDGSVTVFLRGDLRRKIVYTAHVVGAGAVPGTFTGELAP